MSARNPGPQVGDQLTADQLGGLPVGSAAVLAVDFAGNPVPRPPSALLRSADGWRAADRDDTGSPNSAAMYRVLFLPDVDAV